MLHIFSHFVRFELFPVYINSYGVRFVHLAKGAFGIG